MKNFILIFFIIFVLFIICNCQQPEPADNITNNYYNHYDVTNDIIDYGYFNEINETLYNDYAMYSYQLFEPYNYNFVINGSTKFIWNFESDSLNSDPVIFYLSLDGISQLYSFSLNAGENKIICMDAMQIYINTNKTNPNTYTIKLTLLGFY